MSKMFLKFVKPGKGITKTENSVNLSGDGWPSYYNRSPLSRLSRYRKVSRTSILSLRAICFTDTMFSVLRKHHNPVKNNKHCVHFWDSFAMFQLRLHNGHGKASSISYIQPKIAIVSGRDKVHEREEERDRERNSMTEKQCHSTSTTRYRRGFYSWADSENRPSAKIPASAACRSKIHIPGTLAQTNASPWPLLSVRQARGRMGNPFFSSRCMAGFSQTVYYVVKWT